MADLLHDLEEKGKEAGEILKVMRDARQLLAAYKEFTIKHVTDNDIVPILAEQVDKLEAKLRALLVRPV